MKIAVTGDFHFGDKRNSIYQDNEFLKINEIHYLMFELLERFREQRLDAIILLGDIFDSKILDVTLISRLIFWLNSLDKLDIPVYIFPGNHESSAQKTSLDFIGQIAYKNIQYIGNPSCWNTENKYSFIFLPFFNEKIKTFIEGETEQEFIAECLQYEKKNIVFGHLWLNGAFLNENSGEEWIDKKELDFNGVDWFISGHIHKKQTFMQGDTHIHYPGSPFFLDFGDSPKEEKTFSIIDLDTNEIKEIPITEKPVVRKYYTYYLKSASELEKYADNDFDYIKFKIAKTLKHEIPGAYWTKKNFFFEILTSEELENEEKISDVSFEEIVSIVTKKRNLEKKVETKVIKHLLKVKEELCL